MEIADLERRQTATEWDSAWFCYECDKMMHWKKKAFVLDEKCLCAECAKTGLEKNKEIRYKCK